jgi:hypothetical protein
MFIFNEDCSKCMFKDRIDDELIIEQNRVIISIKITI